MGYCAELLEPDRAEGIHRLLTRLLGRCTCEDSIALVHQLYSPEPDEERMTA